MNATNEIGTMMQKVYYSLAYYFLTANVLGFFASIINPVRVWILQEVQFIGLLFVAIVIDLFFGVWKHWKQHTFSFKEMLTGFLTKTVVCYLAMILFMSFSSFEGSETFNLGSYFLIVGRFLIFLYPAGSAMTNMNFVTDGKFPPLRFMKRLKRFEKELIGKK